MLDALIRLQNKNPKTAIGLMSGTSADGIDACIVEISGNGLDTKINILAFETCPYEQTVRDAILEACDPKTGTVDKVCRLNFLLGALFANAAQSVAKKANIPMNGVDIIGSHGQTIFHLPRTGHGHGQNVAPANTGSTLQIGEPAVIAHETGVTTVADFRPMDMAAGGQGAPLIPYVDFLLFRSKKKGRVLQNIGGIANLTFLPKDCAISDVVAFDTGPGNMIIDRITEIITNNAAHFDRNGELAAKGKINNGLLANLLAHPFLTKPPPKTTGREEFGRHFADGLYADATRAGIENYDILATVTAFTARTITDSYQQWILPKGPLPEVILSGGGSYNTTLVKYLQQYLGRQATVHPISKFGIEPNVKESLAFAILANETISGNPNNVPSATGAKKAVVLGKIVPALLQNKKGT